MQLHDLWDRSVGTLFRQVDRPDGTFLNRLRRCSTCAPETEPPPTRVLAVDPETNPSTAPRFPLTNPDTVSWRPLSIRGVAVAGSRPVARIRPSKTNTVSTDPPPRLVPLSTLFQLPGSMSMPRSWSNLRSKGLRAKRLSLADVMGDSMEPKYVEGDSVLVNHASAEPIEGKVFALRTLEGPLVKRLRQEEGQWWAHT